MNKKLIISIIAVVVVIAAGLLWWSFKANDKQLKNLEAFADCINKSGAKFYGAFWCPHCQSQKAMFQTLFGSAEKKLPYVECSTPDTNGQLQVCQDAGI